MRIQNNSPKLRIITDNTTCKYVIIIESKSKYSNDSFNFLNSRKNLHYIEKN